MKKQKQFFWNICKLIKTKTHLHKYSYPYSVLCWSTFGNNYSLESSWVWRYLLGTAVFGEFLPFFSADPLKLCQVGWGASVHSHFQVSPKMFDQVQVRAFRDLSQSHSCVVLAVYFGHCPVGRWTFAPVWRPERSGAGFHQGPLCTLLHSSFPWSRLVSESLL